MSGEKAGRTRAVRRWLVGPDRIELTGEGGRWSARVARAGWGGAGLDVDGVFGDEAGAIAWCETMAEVLAGDAEDDLRDGGDAERA